MTYTRPRALSVRSTLLPDQSGSLNHMDEQMAWLLLVMHRNSLRQPPSPVSLMFLSSSVHRLPYLPSWLYPAVPERSLIGLPT